MKREAQRPGYAEDMSSQEHRLRRRLERVVALHRGATTEGERRAAAEARNRLVRRLKKVRREDPVARFVAGQLAHLSVARPPEPPSVPLPSHRDVARALAAWEDGAWSDAEVQAWAEALVAAVDLPSDPRAEGARRAEVLLQVAMLGRVPLQAEDVPEIRRFLRTGDWEAWFGLIARVALAG